MLMLMDYSILKELCMEYFCPKDKFWLIQLPLDNILISAHFKLFKLL